MRIPHLFKQTIFISFAISLLLMPGCNKRSKPADMKITDPEPDLSISSVNYYISLDRSCPDLPVPGDSSASLAIDVDKDGTADFEMHIGHQLSTGNACGNQCTCFDYSVSISNLH